MGLGTSIKKRLPKRVHRSPTLLNAPGALSAVIAYNEYGGYCLPRSSLHRPACQAVMRGKVWEHDTIKFICKHADGDIVHAGTYFGDFLPALSKAAGANLIWAFEPVHENFRCAEITVRLNDLKNVRLHNAALGSSETPLSFKTVDDKGKSLGGSSHASEAGTTTVPQMVLDRVIPSDRKVTVLQLDVEHFEGDVLRGARELVRRNRPIIILENVPEGFAEEAGYVRTCTIHGNAIFEPRK